MATHGPYHALGTSWFIECFEPTDEQAIATLVQSELEEFEAIFSRFRSDSLLSQLNTIGHLSNPPPLVLSVLNDALRYYTETNGVFNIAVGERLSSLGYDASYSFSPQATLPAVPALPAVLTVTESAIILSGGALDIGGFGKGVAIDLVAKRLTQELGLTEFLINGGGDLFATTEAGMGVTIALAHPTTARETIGAVTVQNCGFAASSPHLRTWPGREEGAPHNHLMSANQVSSYVIAPTAAAADVWATTLAIAPEIARPDSVQCVLVQEHRLLHADPAFTLYTG